MTDLSAGIREETLRYGRVALGLHWIMAILILIAFVSGLVVDHLPGRLPRLVEEAHKDVGLLILALLLVRIAWRAAHPPPPMADMAPLVEKAAKLGHLALYALMILATGVGLFYTIWRGENLNLGLFTVVSPFPRGQWGVRRIGQLHEWLSWALVAFAGLHAVAALWHHHVLRDDTLSRMLPARAGRSARKGLVSPRSA
jgi:cytochrome b561